MKTTLIPFTIIPAFAALSLLVPVGCDDAPVDEEEEQLVADDAEADALAEEEAAADAAELLPEESLDFSIEEAEPLGAYTNRALTMGTASFSQTINGDWSPDKAIDSDLWGPYNGWAIDRSVSGDGTYTENASFRLVDADSGPAATTRVRIVLRFGYGAQHHLGRFRLFVTQSAKSTFAGGANTGGNAVGTAQWWGVDIDSISVSAASGTAPTLTKRGATPGLIEATDCGSNADDVQYVVVGTVPIDRLTGVRIMASDYDPFPLPTGGPGCAVNGNFVLSDFRFFTEPLAL